MVATGLAAARPALAQSKRVMAIGTHPDDEVLMALGRTRTAFVAGDQITVVVVTNGDVDGVEEGLRRQGESVDAATHVGLTEDDVVFMGYPDSAMINLYAAATDTTLITSETGQTATYGNRGLGRMDYHRHVSGGVAGPYTRATVRGDFEALLTNFQPDEIYTHSDFEWHNDHQATAMFITDALTSLKRRGVNLRTKLYQTVVWMPDGVMQWPQLDDAGWAPGVPFLPDSPPCTPGLCLDGTAMEWKRLIHFAQPAEMLLTDPDLNMKATSLPFGGPGWFGSFTRKDEFFWLKDFGTNMATTASVTASSQDLASGLAAGKAVDGIIKGLEGTVGFAWATTPGEPAGAWIQLDWPAPVRVSQVNLWNWDEPDLGGDLLAGTLLFSDGSQVAVGALAGSKRVMPVRFAPKTVSWVRFRVDQAQGSAVGLAEIEVLGALASSTGNVPPHFVEGPWPVSRTISASQNTNISVVASDVDGDPLTYQWAAEAGTVTGSGATVDYTPPAVAATTWFAVSVTVSDGRGGAATNSTYVEVTGAASNSVTVSPTQVFAGDPATGSIVLVAPAPAEGVVVPLTSSQPSLVTVPASVTVPAGALGTTFAVTTAPATAIATSVTITATFSGGPRSATLSIVPMSVASLSVAPASVLGGTASQGTVTLPAPVGAAGASVQLTSSAPATATVPASVTIPAGASTATFPVSTVQVAAATTVTLSATWGTTATAPLTVTPGDPPVGFSLLTPANGSTVDTLTPTFTWQAWSGTGLSRYELRVDGACVACAIPASRATFTLTTPLTAGSHAWTVWAIDAAANAIVATGAPWTFTAREDGPEPGPEPRVEPGVEPGAEPGPEAPAEPPRDAGIDALADAGPDGPAETATGTSTETGTSVNPGLDASPPDGATVDGGEIDGGSGSIDAVSGATGDAERDGTQVTSVIDGASDSGAPGKSGVSGGGCGCVVGGSDSDRSSLRTLLLVGLLALARRRRR